MFMSPPYCTHRFRFFSHRLYETAQRLHSYFRKRDARQKAKKNHEAKNDREAYIDSVQDSVLRSEPIQEPIVSTMLC